MNANFSKTAALTAMIALGFLFSNPAHAAVLRSSDGAPVLTSEGTCVITEWQGSEGCEAAKMASGMGDETSAKTERYHVNAVFFDFNKTVLTAEAKQHLDHLAKWLHIKARNGQNITVAGFTDRIGNAAYNEKLALKRARAVRDYLVTKGIKPKKIEVRSLGKTEPRAECAADLPHAKLVECLREDRRAEVEFVDGK